MIDDPEAAVIELLVRRLLAYVFHMLPTGPQRTAIARDIVYEAWQQFLLTEEADFRDATAAFETLCRIARVQIRVGAV